MSVELSLYKLADVLQLDLEYSNGRISGGGSLSVPTDIGLNVLTRLEVRASFYSDQCGVLVHVAGDLYILASHYPKLGGVGAYLVDAAKLKVGGVKATPERLITSKMSIKEVISILGGAVIKAFYYNRGKWSSLAIPS